MANYLVQSLEKLSALSRRIGSLGLGIYVAASLTACPSSKKAGPPIDTPNPASTTAPLSSGGTSRTGGGQDGGGGEIAYSTPEQVIEALEAARTFLLSEHSDRYLESAATSAMAWGSVKPQDFKEKRYMQGLKQSIDFKKVSEVLSKIKDPSKAEGGTISPASYKKIADYLGLSRVHYEKNDTKEANCSKNKNESYPDAFVESFKYGAPICFNVRKLQRIPKDGLKQHALALWLHELSHLSGVSDEKVAYDVENFILWSESFENQRQLNRLSGAVFFSAANLHKAIYLAHKYHIRNQWLLDLKAKGEGYVQTNTFESYKGYIVGLFEASSVSLKALQDFQTQYIFHGEYAKVFAEIKSYEKLHERISIEYTFTGEVGGYKETPVEDEEWKLKWDRLRLLSFCGAVAAQKISVSSSLDGKGARSSDFDFVKTEIDEKQCDHLDEIK